MQQSPSRKRERDIIENLEDIFGPDPIQYKPPSRSNSPQLYPNSPNIFIPPASPQYNPTPISPPRMMISPPKPAKRAKPAAKSSSSGDSGDYLKSDDSGDSAKLRKINEINMANKHSRQPLDDKVKKYLETHSLAEALARFSALFKKRFTLKQELSLDEVNELSITRSIKTRVLKETGSTKATKLIKAGKFTNPVNIGEQLPSKRDTKVNAIREYLAAHKNDVHAVRRRFNELHIMRFRHKQTLTKEENIELGITRNISRIYDQMTPKEQKAFVKSRIIPDRLLK